MSQLKMAPQLMLLWKSRGQLKKPFMQTVGVTDQQKMKTVIRLFFPSNSESVDMSQTFEL